MTSFRKKIYIFLILILPGILPATAEQKLQVTISWKYKELPSAMKIYIPSGKSPEDYPLWKTKSVQNLNEIPIGKEIKNGKFTISKGEAFRFVLVYENSSNEDIYFFAAPHRVDPEENALGFKFKCLCVNHAFYAPPKGFWYRVVEFRTSQHLPGESLNITHTLIRVTKEELENFSYSGPSL